MLVHLLTNFIKIWLSPVKAKSLTIFWQPKHHKFHRQFVGYGIHAWAWKTPIKISVICLELSCRNHNIVVHILSTAFISHSWERKKLISVTWLIFLGVVFSCRGRLDVCLFHPSILLSTRILHGFPFAYTWWRKGLLIYQFGLCLALVLLMENKDDMIMYIKKLCHVSRIQV